MDTLFVGLRVVVSLAAVLGLLWFIQRRVAKTGRVTRQAKHVTVVARQGISGKASVAVVDVEGVRYVLGVTEQSVSVLGSGEAPQDAVVTPIAPAASAPAAAAFAQTLAAQPAAVVPVATPAALVDSPRRAARAAAATPQAPAQAAPLAGSILSASTWKQAAAAMRSQKRA
ncbi:flagellar biosynthetic protein FliO [Frondihabitans peucedani]|uniref:Flagellar protein FliO/FliZ n=1 Tax=Frondihabitans peucedani TaxID=598626 RepID=A0ABP8E2Y0_9MICO